MSEERSEERVELLRQLLKEEAGEESFARLASNLGGAEATGPEEGTLARTMGTLEAVFLVAAADGKLYRSEVDEIQSLLSRLLEQQVPPRLVERILDRFAEDLDRDDYDARVASVASTLADDGSRRAAFVMAAGIAWVDGQVQDEESDVIDTMARGFGLEAGFAARVLERIREKMQKA